MPGKKGGKEERGGRGEGDEKEADGSNTVLTFGKEGCMVPREEVTRHSRCCCSPVCVFGNILRQNTVTRADMHW